jgi:hypothetical protein
MITPCERCHEPCDEATTTVLPVPQEGAPGFTSTRLCEACLEPALDVLRALIDRSEHDAAAEALVLRLAARLEAAGSGTAGADRGMAGTRRAVHEALDALGRQVMCSDCFNVVPERKIRILPHYNETLEAFVTTYRCGACWPAAMKDTRERVARATDAELVDLGECLQRNGITVLEALRGDPAPVVRAVLTATLALVDQGKLPIRIGRTSSLGC